VKTVVYSGATAQVEPDSVILRDPAGNHSLQILEQNYRNDPVAANRCCSRCSRARRLILKKADEGQHGNVPN
jgi:hypothetical protein